MIESIMSLKISGRCFTPAAKLKCFTQDKSRISIIYGKNGSGKSTISKALCKVEPDLRSELLDKNNNKVAVRQDNIFIFNEDYIKNNVEIQDDGLSAVILLGEQVDIDKQITEANSQLEKIKSELETEKTTKTILEDVKNSDSYEYMQWIEEKINSIYNPILLVDNNIVQELFRCRY